MSHLNGGGGVLQATIQVTRKDTGKVEEYKVTGKLTEDEAQKLGLSQPKEQHGTDTQHHGA